MKLKSLNFTALAFVLITTMVFTGCKKDKSNEPEVIQLPEKAMFVSTYDSNTGATIYLLDGATGALTTKYTYPAQANVTWTYAVAGNGFLYSLDNNKINAINMTTGAVVWTDAVDNASAPVLHDNVFYGVQKINATSYNVYALDATKPSKDYVWKYPLVAAPTGVKHYNGLVYVLITPNRLVALDAKTGALKWDISASDPYSLLSLNNGVIVSGNNILDATNGTQITAASAPAIIPTYGALTNAVWSLRYATKDMYFVETEHYNSETHIATRYISAINTLSGAVKWSHKYDGGFAISHGIWNDIELVWNGQLIVKNIQNNSLKTTTRTYERYWLLDINTGSEKIIFDNFWTFGKSSEGVIANNIHYVSQMVDNGDVFTPAAGKYLFAVDLANAKQVWRDDKLLSGYGGAMSVCVFTAGKAYSPYIQ